MTIKSLNVHFKPSIKRLEFFSKKLVESEYSGQHRSLYKQKGIEFEDYKEFSPGDDASRIDWKASLRRRKLLIREYTQLKNLNVFILLDVSNSMLFSSTGKLKCEYAAELTASLGFYFLESGDNVGLIMFNDKIVKFLPSTLGSKQFFLITDVLTDPKLYGGEFDLTKTAHYVAKLVRQGSLVLIISDFIGLKKKWERAIQLLSRKADVMGLIIRDPHDMTIKDKVGQAIISDPFSDKTLIVDFDKIKNSFEKNALERLNYVRQSFRRNRSDSILLMTDKHFSRPVINFFSAKRKRMV